jgi:hypothetical protein
MKATRPHYTDKPVVKLGLERECLRCHKIFDVASERNPFQFCPECRAGEKSRNDCPSCDRTDRRPGRSECDWCAKLRRTAKKTAAMARLRNSDAYSEQEFNAKAERARAAINYDERRADSTFEIDGGIPVELYSAKMRSRFERDDLDASEAAPLAVASGGWDNYDPKALYRKMMNQHPT